MTDIGNICIVAPPEAGEGKATPAQTNWFKGVSEAARAEGARVEVFRTVLRRSLVRGESGRKFMLLDPWEADRLYKTLHRGVDAVFQAGSARVVLNPSKALETSNTVSVLRLVQHKAFFAQFDGVKAPHQVLDEFRVWCEIVHCNSHKDCRILPLHMFAPGRDWGPLDSAEARDLFERRYGKPGRLKDEHGLAWVPATARHGNDVLTVGRLELPKGLHWDTTASGSPARLSSLTATWYFKGEAYVNVSPDGFIRAGQSSGVTARKEWEAPRPPAPEAPARAMRKNRRPR